MAEAGAWEFAGTRGKIAVRDWANPDARYVAVLAHGYGEHIGRYDHVAGALVRDGATVCGPDHIGHGRSDGERVLVEDFGDVVADLHTVVTRTSAAYPGLPVVLIGHSMGGMIAARYAQLHGPELSALVLSGPVLGSWEPLRLADAAEIPDEPLDTATLSRDPAVGAAYAADPLVWHGPFKRDMLRAIARCLAEVNTGGRLGRLPTLWAHGGGDRLVPPPATRAGLDRIRGDDLTERVYPGAQHEIFNETNAGEVLADVTTFIHRHVP